MTPRERELISRFVITPHKRKPRITKEEFLQRFRPHVSDGQKLSLDLLNEALHAKNPEDVDDALIVGFNFGFSPKHVDMLCELSDADWHFSHEDIVSALDEVRDPRAIETLYKATQKVPEYLVHDESRSLAVKAIYALGNISHPSANEKLRLLSESKNEILRETALLQLEYRANSPKFPPEV
ncbi:MAG: HEAT repeat domain-containing protein [Verrucomicrobiota bacterium]